MKSASRALRRRRSGGPHGAALLLVAIGLAAAAPAHAESNTVDARFNILDAWFNNIPSVTASARLDFTLNIEKMLFLRVGAGGSHGSNTSGAGPAANASIASVTLNLTPTIPAGGTIPLTGNNQGVSWNSAAPSFLNATPVTVPVEVRSNAGQVRISGQATAPLTSGTNTIPMSSISIASSDAGNLPAPAVPNAGSGTPVNIAPGGPGTAAAPALLTQRSANWVFGFSPSAPMPAPGSYSGTITFTATSL